MENNKTSWSPTRMIAAIILLLILGIIGIVAGPIAEKNKASKEVAGIEAQALPKTVQTVSYEGQDGKTALEILKETHNIKTQESSMGIFVTSINDTTNTPDTFWMFYINNQLGPIGADQYKTKAGEKIEWRFEKFE